MKARPRILIVEDDDEMRQALSDLLEKNGYEIDVAEDGIGALNKLWINSYDLAVTDVIMPGVNGLKLMSIARTIPSEVDFLVITGNDSEENREEAFRLGAKGYLRKPFTTQEFLSALITIRPDRAANNTL